jgi:hypothetical protein
MDSPSRVPYLKPSEFFASKRLFQLFRSVTIGFMPVLPMNLSTCFAAMAKRLAFDTANNLYSRTFPDFAVSAKQVHSATITYGLGNALTALHGIRSRPNERLWPRTVARGPVASMHNLGNLYHQIGHVPLSVAKRPFSTSGAP